MISLICVLPNVGVVRQSHPLNNISHGSVVTTISGTPETLHGHSTTTYKKWIQSIQPTGTVCLLRWSLVNRLQNHNTDSNPISSTVYGQLEPLGVFIRVLRLD